MLCLVRLLLNIHTAVLVLCGMRQSQLCLQASEVPNLLEQLQDCNVQLDIVEKGLNDLLDTKKMAFPRSAHMPTLPERQEKKRKVNAVRRS